jgi:hypothetical protein
MFALFIAPLTQNFAAACADHTFLGLIPWYHYLTLVQDSATNTCKITNFDDTAKVLGSQSPFLLIGLAILDDLIRVAALVAVGFVIYGGIQYVTSQGSPDSTNKARQTIINALVGLVLAVVAASLVSFIGGRLAGNAGTL